MYKVMISVGEASGDLHGASVAKALKQLHPDIQLFGMGGTQMRQAGVEIVYDIADLGVIGLVEVIRNLRRLFRLRDYLADLMDKERPDALVIIDYPGFNMRLAKVAKQKGIPVVSYIAPTVWAWGKGRAKGVAETVNRVASIFPFEAEIYRQAGADVTFVGHPLLDIVKPTLEREAAYAHFGADATKPLVLLLPGSRKQEIEKLLPDMLAAAEKIRAVLPECQFFLPIASTISPEMLHNIIGGYDVPVTLTHDATYDLMNIADAAIAASGTVTLEAALLGLPTVIIYKVAALTYWLGRMLVKIPYISLPNIIAGRKVMPELLQTAVQPGIIAEEVLAFLQKETVKKQALQDLREVRERLGEAGAVERVAKVIIEVAAQPNGGK